MKSTVSNSEVKSKMNPWPVRLICGQDGNTPYSGASHPSGRKKALRISPADPGGPNEQSSLVVPF